MDENWMDADQDAFREDDGGIPPDALLYCHPCQGYKPYTVRLGDILCECGYIFATMKEAENGTK
jgi:hypothetical protein